MSKPYLETYEETLHRVYELDAASLSPEQIDEVLGERKDYEGGVFIRYEGENGEWYQSYTWQDYMDALDDVEGRLESYGEGYNPTTIQVVFVSFH